MRHLTYAIGDIHGRLDLFEAARSAIEAHAVMSGAGRTVVCLGDYIDRGPDSARLVERLIGLQGRGFICLKGNHEAMMIEALQDPTASAADMWLDNGGQQTLSSYGSLMAIPKTHLDWMAALPLWWEEAGRYFVHAGVEPKIAMERQDEAALLWIRDRFLLSPAADLPGHVVHGHTPRWRGKPDMSLPERLPQRTNLDTGAWTTGVLSVGVFDPARTGGPLEILAIRESA